MAWHGGVSTSRRQQCPGQASWVASWMVRRYLKESCRPPSTVCRAQPLVFHRTSIAGPRKVIVQSAGCGDPTRRCTASAPWKTVHCGVCFADLETFASSQFCFLFAVLGLVRWRCWRKVRIAPTCHRNSTFPCCPVSARAEKREVRAEMMCAAIGRPFEKWEQVLLVQYQGQKTMESCSLAASSLSLG